MRPRTLALVLGVCVASSAGVGTADGVDLVRLVEWEQPAVLISGGGAGRESFELTARAAWARGASGSYLARTVLPDGRTETQPVRFEAGGAPRTIVTYVPAATVRNLRPPAVLVRLSLVDPATNTEMSNPLFARIDDFPHPRPEGAEVVSGPFGWGRPLSGPPGQARLLPRPGPDDFRFVRVPGTQDRPGFFLATTEASNAQVARRLAGYNPRAGRSDEFLLEDPAQPAVGLTIRQALAYLASLSKADPSGVVYRLPTTEQWNLAARAGRGSAFWWGDEPAHPAGANLLGAEPGLQGDSTAPGVAGFAPNPWGLFHTFGNVAEWARSPSGGFARLGGHFRTEPASPLPEVAVVGNDTTGPDPYVGVRPSFDLDERTGADLVRRLLGADPGLASIQVSFDPDRATATLRGALPDSSGRRLADSRLASAWFLAAVEDQIETPTFGPGQLALLGKVAGPVRRITPLGRWFYQVPVEVRWADPLPVSGSSWWVNVYLPGGGHTAHRLVEVQPDRSGRVIVLIDRARMAAAGLPVDTPVSVALSLGSEAPTPADPHVVSNIVIVRWSLR